MKPDSSRILSAYQHLMRPHERLAARWLTETWDGETDKVPSWLRNRVFLDFPAHVLDAPPELARFIILRVLQDHRAEIRDAERSLGGSAV